jgi:hypothetical protein
MTAEGPNGIVLLTSIATQVSDRGNPCLNSNKKESNFTWDRTFPARTADEAQPCSSSSRGTFWAHSSASSKDLTSQSAKPATTSYFRGLRGTLLKELQRFA